MKENEDHVPPNNKEKNYGIQLVRIAACMMILLHHLSAAFGVAINESLGKCAVSIFIVITGFLSGVRKNTGDYNTCSISRIVSNVKSKLARIYPYYFLSFIVGIVFLFFRPDLNKSGHGLAFQSITFLLMVQGWFFDEGIYFEVNAVCWYMSFVLFFSFMEPVLLAIIQKCNMVKRIILMSVCFLTLVIISVFFDYYEFDNLWLLYICPLTRLLDCFIAMIIGSLASEMKLYCSIFVGTILEVFALASAVIFLILPLNVVWQSNVGFLPVSIVVVLVFYYQKGRISFLANNKFLLRLAELTMIIYLFHQEVYMVVHLLNKSILHFNSTIISIVSVLTTLITAFVLKTVVSYIGSKIMKNDINA